MCAIDDAAKSHISVTVLTWSVKNQYVLRTVVGSHLQMMMPFLDASGLFLRSTEIKKKNAIEIAAGEISASQICRIHFKISCLR